MTLLKNLFVKHTKTIVLENIESENTTITDMKNILYERLNIVGQDRDHVRLLYNGKVLDDEKYLHSYNVEDYSTIHLFFAMYPNRVKINMVE